MDKQNAENIYNRTLFSLKKEGILTHGATWIISEDITLSKISESQKDKYCIPLI